MTRGYVYLLWENGTNGFKIGHSRIPDRRSKGLNTGNPRDLNIIGIISTDNIIAKEKEFHRKFAEYRSRGEWFHFPPDVIGIVLGMFDSELLEQLKRSETLTNGSPTIKCYEPQSPVDHPINFFQQSVHLKTPFFEQTGWLEKFTHTWGQENSWNCRGNYLYCWIEQVSGEKVEKHQGFCRTKELQFRNGTLTDKTSAYSETRLKTITRLILNQEPYSEILPRLNNRKYYREKDSH